MKVLHISDLHFSAGSHRAADSHTHSVPHLIALAAKVGGLCPDWTVLSGDISNHGDAESLLRARDYLFHGLSIGGGERVGLGLETERTLIVPGNHDAWNGTRVGGVADRMQKSLENFNDVFKEYRVESPGAISWNWVPVGETGVIFCTVNSCFLGDPELPDGDNVAGASPIDRVACGKLSTQQSRELLDLCDRGFLGRLATGDGAPIKASAFARSLKILVMHHYIFDPPRSRREPFLDLYDRDAVFANQAMAGFDLLLCGHKHENAFTEYTIGEHLDRRAKRRLVINIFRRMLGIRAMPMKHRGKLLPKTIGRLVQLLWTRRQPGLFETGSETDLLIQMLRMSIEHPDVLNNQLGKWINLHESEWPEISREELDEIASRIRRNFDAAQRAKLIDYARSLDRILMQVQDRKFVQSMCGSTTKKPRDDAVRSFCVYDISRDEHVNSWRVRRESYEYNPRDSQFRQQHIVREFAVKAPFESGVFRP